jgi:hypothetical protein
MARIESRAQKQAEAAFCVAAVNPEAMADAILPLFIESSQEYFLLMGPISYRSRDKQVCNVNKNLKCPHGISNPRRGLKGLQ